MRSTIRRFTTVLGVISLTLGVAHTVAAQTGQTPDLPSDIEVETLTTDTVDPTSLDVAPDGRVIFAERDGVVKVWHQDGTLVTAGEFDVAACGFDCTGDPNELEEGGIHGLLLASDFATSGRVFLYYSAPGTYDEETEQGLFRVSTFVLSDDDVLDVDSEQVILEIPTEWLNCCHYGGDMERMADGTIVMSVGDDTSPREEGWNPRDEREGRKAFNAERTSQNPADLRGKIIRFNEDGTAPADNPFVDDPAYHPLVYAMGFRSNYRIGYDPVTNAVLVGNVGPDATTADENRGPAGHDEFEVVLSGGGTNHGWPRCIGDNMAYQDYDYETGESGGPLSCEGMTPAQIYYPGRPTPDFPLMAFGARTAIAGPAYRYDGDGALQLPERFQGAALLMEWSRDAMYAVDLDDQGNLLPETMEIVSTSLKHPIDAKIGPDGAVYLVEYGEFYYNNGTSEISRMKCTGCTADPADYSPAPGGGDPDPAPEPEPTEDAAPEPQPAPDDEPTLPATGGGLALVGAVLIAAGTLRRRTIV